MAFAALESGKTVQVLVALGTVPLVTAKSGLTAYCHDAFGLDVSGAALREVTVDDEVPRTVVMVNAVHFAAPPARRGATAAATAAASDSSPPRQKAAAHDRAAGPHHPSGATMSVDSLSALGDLVRLCHQQARDIDLLERGVADGARSLVEEGPRSALIAERGRGLLLAAELEDTKRRLRESEETVREFAAVVAQLKNDVRQLVELNSIADFQSGV
jgi:hypothetical protein